MKKLISSTKNKLKALYKKAEKQLLRSLPKATWPALVATGAVASVAVLVLIVAQAVRSSHPSSYTVMITNRAGTGGGSGSVIETDSGESKILTNAHVCEGALKKGGVVTKVNGEKHLVTGYYLSDEHDLCLVTVAADLHDKVDIASSAPSIYDEATITGHPSLMPNVINKGHFGGRMIISIMTGMRKCTESELKDPRSGFLCMLIGGMPVIKTFESAVVSATIMPGSSGSAVLNSNNELSGVVFAGNSRGLSYALIVPYEAVRNFLSKEMKIKQLGKKLTPWDEQSSDSSEEQQSFRSISDLNELIKKACENPENKEKPEDLCEKVRNSVYLKEEK